MMTNRNSEKRLDFSLGWAIASKKEMQPSRYWRCIPLSMSVRLSQAGVLKMPLSAVRMRLLLVTIPILLGPLVRKTKLPAEVTRFWRTGSIRDLISWVPSCCGVTVDVIRIRVTPGLWVTMGVPVMMTFVVPPPAGQCLNQYQYPQGYQLWGYGEILPLTYLFIVFARQRPDLWLK